MRQAIDPAAMNEMIAQAETILLYQMRDAYFSEDQSALLRAFYALAQSYWAQGNAESAAENLAFILLQGDSPPDLQAAAAELMADIESRVCPRLVLDARSFAAAMDLQGMVEYQLEDNLN